MFARFPNTLLLNVSLWCTSMDGFCLRCLRVYGPWRKDTGEKERRRMGVRSRDSCLFWCPWELQYEWFRQRLQMIFGDLRPLLLFFALVRPFSKFARYKVSMSSAQNRKQQNKQRVTGDLKTWDLKNGNERSVFSKDFLASSFFSSSVLQFRASPSPKPSFPP